jgi:uncharacterized iron-regulated protein
MIMGRLLAVWAISAAVILTGCAADKDSGSTSRWKSPLYQDHPLAGQVWKPAAERRATAGEVYGALKKADFVLIGEKHDNADHHWLQAKLVSELAAQGRKATLVFEMLTESQQAPLDAHLAHHAGDAAGIGAAVGWEQSGWPDWEMYQPVAQQALYNDMPLLAGGLDREMTKRIAREGPAALGDERAAALKLDEPVGEDLRAEMRQVIFDSHCQQLPEPMLDPMLSVTLAKDAVMADRMIQPRTTRDSDVAVLIAGTGHARADWGVPLHLARLAPGARIVTVGLVEVEKDVIDPASYAERFEGKAAFDFVWFTPRVDDDDPCEVFAEQLRRMREKRKNEEGGDAS